MSALNGVCKQFLELRSYMHYKHWFWCSVHEVTHTVSCYALSLNRLYSHILIYVAMSSIYLIAQVKQVYTFIVMWSAPYGISIRRICGKFSSALVCFSRFYNDL